MTVKRVAAVVAAVVLIVGAFLVRRNVLDDDEPPPPDSAPTTAPAIAAGSIVCSTELAAACAAIGDADPDVTVTVEPAGRTLDRLAALPDAADVPVWLTVSPFPEMVDSLRTVNGLAPLGGSVEALATTPLIVATPTGGRSDALATGCAGDPLWRCLGDHASGPWTELGGEPEWRTVRPSLGLVEEEATALASFAAAVAGYLGSPDVTRSAWEADPAFIPWLRRLAGAVDPGALSAGTPLATMATRAGSLDVAAASAAELADLDAGSDRFDASYPEPSMDLQAVLAVPDGVSADGDLGALAAGALATWDPPTSGSTLPSATTMLALRALWQEAT